MNIKIDIRENDLLQKITQLVTNIPLFKDIQIKSEVLPLGDIIVCNEDAEIIVIERKTLNDLLSSIKDGRYEEQSYRLNGLDHHNHNIIYLIEGDINRMNHFKMDNKLEKQTLYSSMFSLNYYKGFSVFRSISLEETAIIICNMTYKLKKEKDRKPYYENKKDLFVIEEVNQNLKKENNLQDVQNNEPNEPNENNEPNETNENNETNKKECKNYVNVVKKIKKENITQDNIDEIMLCQIPGISSVTALAIINKYNSLSNLIKELDKNNDCLNEITSKNEKGQIRKISKTSISNIVKFLLKK
jgi:crossover junction endonuclease MUS81